MTKALNTGGLQALMFVVLLSPAASLTSCQKRSAAVGVTSIAQAAPAFFDLNISLTDAADVPLAAQRVSWRPVFEAPGSGEGGTALTDDTGHLVVSRLLPGVRYLFSTVFAGQTVQRWYRVPTTGSSASVEGWQWILNDALHLKNQSGELTPRARPERLLYISGSASTFASALAIAAEQMETLPLNPSDLRPSSDLVWWVNGDFDVEPALLTSAAQEALEAFIFAGGRLILNGEWAGMYSVLRDQTQALGSELGVQVSQDTLAQSEASFTVDNIHRHWLTERVQTLTLSRSGSVRVYNPTVTEELAFAPSEHYRIASLREQHTVLAVLRYGEGAIIALGDSSLWSDRWLAAKDNQQLWLNSLAFAVPVASAFVSSSK